MNCKKADNKDGVTGSILSVMAQCCFDGLAVFPATKYSQKQQYRGGWQNFLKSSTDATQKTSDCQIVIQSALPKKGKAQGKAQGKAHMNNISFTYHYFIGNPVNSGGNPIDNHKVNHMHNHMVNNNVLLQCYCKKYQSTGQSTIKSITEALRYKGSEPFHIIHSLKCKANDNT